MNPILEVIRFLAENTVICEYINIFCIIGIMDYGWRVLWRAVKDIGNAVKG